MNVIEISRKDVIDFDEKLMEDCLEGVRKQEHLSAIAGFKILAQKLNEKDWGRVMSQSIIDGEFDIPPIKLSVEEMQKLKGAGVNPGGSEYSSYKKMSHTGPRVSGFVHYLITGHKDGYKV